MTISIVSFYFILSLEAHWFSTMFAVLVFTDVVQTGTAFVAVVAGLLVLAGTLKGFLNENHLHSLGKMVFASTGFWAYIYFCQFMLIWYANIPEETIYFIRRSEQGWLPYFLLLPVLKFVVPFLLLVPRDAKRNPRKLVPVALLILFAQFWELYLMVAPAMGHGAEAAHAHLPLVEFAATLGFVGLFTLVFGWSLARHDAGAAEGPGVRGVPRLPLVTLDADEGDPARVRGPRPRPGRGRSGRAGGVTAVARARAASPMPTSPVLTARSTWRDVRVTLSVSPRPPTAFAKQRVRVRVESGGVPLALDGGRISFEMAMPMGDHRYALVAGRDGWQEAEVVLPVCTSGNPRWYAIVEGTVAGRPTTARFRLDVTQAGSAPAPAP